MGRVGGRSGVEWDGEVWRSGDLGGGKGCEGSGVERGARSQERLWMLRCWRRILGSAGGGAGGQDGLWGGRGTPGTAFWCQEGTKRLWEWLFAGSSCAQEHPSVVALDCGVAPFGFGSGAVSPSLWGREGTAWPDPSLGVLGGFPGGEIPVLPLSLSLWRADLVPW